MPYVPYGTLAAPTMAPRRRTELLLYALLFAVIVWIYRDGIADVPRGDEIAYRRERDFVAPGWAWLAHVASFSRTRLLSGESRTLFRPVTELLLGATAAMPSFDGLFARGLLGLAMHFGVSVALIELLRKRLPPIAAGLLGLTFAVQYTGVEMVLWRSIHGYLFAVLMVLVGLSCAVRASRVSGYVAGAALTLGLMSYEPTAGACAAVLALGVARRDRRLLWIGAAPLAVFALVDAVDLGLIHRTVNTADPFPARPRGFALSLPGMLADLWGVSAVGWLAPSAVDLTLATPWHRLEWDFSRIPVGLFRAAGVGAWALVIAGVGSAARALRRDRAARDDLAVLGVAGFAVTIAALFTWGRTGPRGLAAYLGVSTYYFYFTSLAFLLVAAWTLGPLIARLKRPIPELALALFCVSQLATSAPAVARHLEARAPALTLVTDSFGGVARALPRVEGCYAGAVDDLLRRIEPMYAPAMIADGRSCANRFNTSRATRWVVASRGAAYALVPLRNPSWTRVPFPGPDPERVVGMASHARFVGPDAVSPTAVRVRVRDQDEGGLLAGVTPERTIAFVFRGSNFGAWGMRPDGSSVDVMPNRQLYTWDRASVPLELRRIEGRWWALHDDVIVGSLAGVTELDGRVGVAHMTSGARPQRFERLEYATDDGGLDWSRAVRIELPILSALQAQATQR